MCISGRDYGVAGSLGRTCCTPAADREQVDWTGGLYRDCGVPSTLCVGFCVCVCGQAWELLDPHPF